MLKTYTKCQYSFLKLCKVKYYNYSPIYNVQKGFSFQTGDPLGPSSKDSDGGSCIWGLLSPSKPRTFEPEVAKRLKHDERGTVSFACAPSAKDPDVLVAGSQFIVTLGDNIEYLNGKAAIFGRLAEGFDALEKINDAFADDEGRPLKDIRILHTVVLEDPFPDPANLTEPDKSPLPTPAQLATVRIAYDEDLAEETDEAALARLKADREAKAQALTLEMVGDLPFADVKPPENILFVCKLNPVTQDSDLELLFSRFGTILSCEIIRDKRTGDSLQYAFIEYEKQADCERAYGKMQDVLIDDHRIHVDFSQSVSKLSDVWRDSQNTRRQFKRGGGFGGVKDLEKRRQYRGVEDEGRGRGGGYGMVEEEQDKDELMKERDQYVDRVDKKERRRSRSPRDRDRDRNGGARRNEGNGRDDRRYDDRRRDDRRDRDRNGGRYRDDRRRDRSRDRHRDYDRRR
jgi:peptidyl-prolyl cis-trans isomerase-like 4